MSLYMQRLLAFNLPLENRRWVFIPYDQLHHALGFAARLPPERLGMIFIDSAWKARRRPYHKQKLALVMTNVRHFALEQAARGVAVWHTSASGLYRDALRPLSDRFGSLWMMRAAERELRADLSPLVAEGRIEVASHEGWLTTREQFETAQQGPPWRMDAFYRHVRRETGILMTPDGRPIGGKFSFDAENRRPWKGKPPAPRQPCFEPDEITREVGEWIERHYADHPGRLDLTALPATRADAERFLAWALEECLPHFGPFEDAMSADERTLFHTRLSSLINLHRLLPREVLCAVLQRADRCDLASVEGFVRQLLGWREFVRHVHDATDGFRDSPGDVSCAATPGNGGYGRWSGRSWSREAAQKEPDGGAAPNALSATTPLPMAFWGRASGLRCLDEVVAGVWEEGWSHHISRLMVLGNIATLLDVSPRELTDWFWAAYTDAYDWVVEPNVLGMATPAVSDLMMTKPYIAGANYIHKMSDFCRGCAFDPQRNCPLTRLYWAFLDRQRAALQDNPRLRMPFAGLKRRSALDKQRDQKTFERVRDLLADGRRCTPAEFD